MKYQVFYSKDCDMYGVRKWNDRGKFWQQVLPPRKTQGARNGQSAYTCYKGVAQRWLKELKQQITDYRNKEKMK